MARGKPDFSSPVIPGSPEQTSGQSMFWWAEGVDVSANSTSLGTVYTIPAGKKLVITGLDVSCGRSFLALFQLVKGSAVVHQFWFDMRGFIPITVGSVDFAAAEVLKRKIWNYDTVNSNNFKVNILGYEVDA